MWTERKRVAVGRKRVAARRVARRRRARSRGGEPLGCVAPRVGELGGVDACRRRWEAADACRCGRRLKDVGAGAGARGRLKVAGGADAS